MRPPTHESSKRSRGVSMILDIRGGRQALVLVLSTLWGCGEGEKPTITEPPVVANVVVTPNNPTLTSLGESVQLSAQARDATGAPIAGKTFTWASSAPDVLSVHAGSGVVTAEANGTATITATVDGVSGGATVEASQVVVAVTVSPDSWTLLEVGHTRPLAAQATDTGDSRVEDAVFLWESSDETVVTVDAEGVVTAAGLGTARVTASVDGIEGEAELTVGGTPTLAPIVYTTRMARTVVSPTVLAGGALYLRYGAIVNGTEPWSMIPKNDVSQFQWETNRIGILAGGTLSVSDPVSGMHDVHTRDSWLAVKSGASRFQLEGNRIGVLLTDGGFQVKDGSTTPWTPLVTSGAVDFQLEGNRIGMLLDGGTFKVKDGINGTWTDLVASGAADFQLEGNRIGVQLDGGPLKVKDGVSGTWTDLVASGAADFQLEGNRIGVLLDGGLFKVKDGINGTWTDLVASGAVDFQLEGDRIGVLLDGGLLKVKDGINGTWTDLVASGAVDFELGGDRIGVFLDGGELKVKEGITGNWSTFDGPWGGDPVSQFRSGVDSPVVYQSTSQYVVDQAALCRDQYFLSGEVNDHRECYPVWRQAPLQDPLGLELFGVGKYGRYCGNLIPERAFYPDESTYWLGQPNPPVLDPIDGLCRDHDRAVELYGYEAKSTDFHMTGKRHFRLAACIVRFGADNDVVTLNGATVSIETLQDMVEWEPTLEARSEWLNTTTVACGPLVYEVFKEHAPYRN